MTTPEANQFITDVLKSLWDRWEPQDAQIRGWVIRLLKFDYGRAEKAVNDLFFSTPARLSPPADKIMCALKDNAFVRTPKGENPMVLLYRIIRQSDFDNNVLCPWSYDNYYARNAQSLPPWQEVQERAERSREKINQYYGQKHIIIYPKRKKESNL